MGMYEDTMMIEGVEGHEAETEFDYYAAIQRQINAGQWGLQGSHGRTMMEAIRGGQCLLGKSRAQDYYGNVIPSRDDVMDGTKGSRGFVVEAMGEEWAAKMEAL
jgi:hypothetical protein